MGAAGLGAEVDKDKRFECCTLTGQRRTVQQSAAPVIADAAAATVHTTIALPSLRPLVWQTSPTPGAARGVEGRVGKCEVGVRAFSDLPHEAAVRAK